MASGERPDEAMLEVSGGRFLDEYMSVLVGVPVGVGRELFL
jgi:hypothetical protein